MSHLDPEARKVLSLARAARTPSAADKQRVRRRIALASATSVAAATAAEVAHAAGAHGSELTQAAGADGGAGQAVRGGVARAAARATPAVGALKLYVAGAALTLAAVGYALLPGSGPARPADSVTDTTTRAPLAGPAAPQLSAASHGVPEQPVPSASASTSQPSAADERAPGVADHKLPQAALSLKPRGAAQRGHSGSLGRELDLLHGAQAAWRARDSQQVLLLLDQHARAYPKSELRDERGALRVLALCELGRGREARRLGQALIRRAPSSPVRATIEESCAFQ